MENNHRLAANHFKIERLSALLRQYYGKYGSFMTRPKIQQYFSACAPYTRGHFRAGLVKGLRKLAQPILYISLVLIILVPNLFNLAQAKSYQSPEALRSSAKTYLNTQLSKTISGDVEITIGKLDRRLRLNLCETEPTAFLPTGSKLQGKLTIGLRCVGQKPWTVYIPVQIKTFTDVVGAAHPLNRNTKISEGDVIKVRYETSNLHSGFFVNKNNVIGKVLKRNMNAGQIFTPRKIKAPLLVHRGDEVTIIASTGGIQVRVKGKAMKDAAKGEQLPVRNIRSKRIVQGIAVKSGTVSVRM